ncbi:hypothetical protein PHAVU_003G096101, partial [Phaseolus vulgaris]
LGYVDRAFAIEFQKELGKEWTLADSEGNVHIVEYNENLLSPEILSGWFNLFDFYGFIDDNYILFRYVGHNAFHITVYMDDVPQSGVNRYLEEIEGKEPLSIGPFDHFSIKLSRLSIQLSYLDLPAKFSQYIRQGRFNKVTLHGLLMDVECKILKGKPPFRRIKLGKGWKNFCSLHSFREGDKIIFECDTRNPSSHIR